MSNGIVSLFSGKEHANHVETDGHGGLVIVIPTSNRYIANNPAILDSIRVHEGSHAVDAMNDGSEMIARAPAGLILGFATNDFAVMSELRAYGHQLAHLNGNLDRYNLNAAGIQQLEWYKTFVEYQKLNYVPDAPRIQPGKPPPDVRGTK